MSSSYTVSYYTSPTAKPEEPKSKRAAFGAMKNKGKIVGDIVEPTANLITWDALE